ncbi:MAG: helix-turn-helix domain-containing protein [Solirubrobacterales bacterium]
MPEIGATLREARMRARIDISEIEAQTKIRAKYLRALENEEWDLLPGPTYVKSFLRTYADALHLDGRRLVEEYKLQHERLSDVELQPIVPPGRRDQRPPSRGFSRLWLVGAALVVLVGALYFLGRNVGGGDDGSPGETQAATTTTTTATTPQTTPSSKGKKKKKAATPTLVRLQVRPTAPVYVCLEAAGGRTLIDGQVLAAGASSDTFRSSRFRIGLGNGSVVLRIDGKSFNVPESSNPIGYEITPKGRRALSESRRPTCAA